MPDVKMPDGTIVRNVPEGTTRAQLMARYGKSAKPNKRPSGAGSSMAHGAGDSLFLGFLDEAGAVMDTLGIGGSGEERPNIWNGSGFDEARRANLKRNREILAEKQRANPGAYLTGQIGAAFVPLPTGKGKLVQIMQNAANSKRAGVAARAGRVAATAAPDVARATVYGAGSAEGDLGQRVRGAGEGALLGAAGNAAGRALGGTVSRALRGKAVSPAVRELADAGVVMTPGQRAGPGTIRKNLEEGVLGSLPVIKSIPTAAKRRGIEQLNIAAINRALAPIGYTLPRGVKPGRDLIAMADDVAYAAYDRSVSGLVLGRDKGLQAAAEAIAEGARANVGPGAGQLNAIVRRTLAQLDDGPLAGSRVRDMLSDLRGEASEFMRATATANERRIGKELWKLHDQIDSALVRQNTKGGVKGFKKARQAVADFKRIKAAAARSPDGVFSPSQLHQAVTKRGYGTTTDKVARGEARLQSLSDAAKQVLPDNLPNSGTAERAAALGLATGGPTGIAALLDPTAGALTGASLLGYVPGVDRLLQNLALNRPDLLIRLGKGAERATPALGTAGAMTALGVNQQP